MGKGKTETFEASAGTDSDAMRLMPDDRQESGTAEDPQTAESERRNLRRLQVMMQLLLGSIAQDPSLSVDEAAQMVANTRNAVLRMFPDKEGAFNMLCRPRIQRAMRARFNIQ